MQLLIRLCLLLALSAMLHGCAPPELPAAWPQALPLYPGAILTGASSKTVRGGAQTPGRQVLRIELRTVDEPQAVLQFYDAAALAAGFNKEDGATSAAQDAPLAVAYAKPGQSFTLSAWIDQRRTRENTGPHPRVTKARLVLTLPVARETGE